MDTTKTIERNGVTLVVEPDLRVRASGPNGETANGRLANSGGHVRIYPRIEFWFGSSDRWIAKYCDRQYWNLYDHEDAAPPRPTDEGAFDLSSSERDSLQTWYDALHPQPQQPTRPRPAPRDSEPIEPIFAIGGLNRGDGAELPTPWPRYGRTCRVCGETESLGAMFTTLGGDICDDCA